MRSPDVADANIVIHHSLDIVLEVAPKQTHQKADFGAWPAEIVFEREGIQRKPGKTDPRSCFGHELNALGSLLVAKKSLQRTDSGPAAVAIHDDRYVLREP